MTANVGAVYLTAAKDQAVYLSADEVTTLREALGKLQTRPTAAGPPFDVEMLARLSRAVEPGDDGGLPTTVVLSTGEQSCLELVRRQVNVRNKLKLRLRHVCTTCGSERIENPSRKTDTTDTTNVDVSAQAVVRSVELLTDGQHWEALLHLLTSLEVSEDETAKKTDAVCGRCDGDEFDTTPITFCPGCRAIRDESILVRCPECDHDFLGPAADIPLWTTITDAMAQRNQAVIRTRATDFENGLWSNQLTALVEAVGREEELLAMFRCGRPDEVGRYVAVLLTTDQLVWAWESPFSAVKSGKIRWAHVRAVREHGDQNKPYERGIALETSEGESIVFTDFRGTGVSLNDPPPEFTADSLHRLMAELHQRSLPESPDERDTLRADAHTR